MQHPVTEEDEPTGGEEEDDDRARRGRCNSRHEDNDVDELVEVLDGRARVADETDHPRLPFRNPEDGSAKDSPAPADSSDNGNGDSVGRDNDVQDVDLTMDHHVKGDDDANKAPPHFLTVRGYPIRFREDWGAGIGGGLWSTGLALARYLGTDHAHEAFSQLWMEQRHRLQSTTSQLTDDADKGRATVGPESTATPAPDEDVPLPLRVVELGSGNGLLSACWLALARSIAASTAAAECDDPTTTRRRRPHLQSQLYVTDTHDHLDLIRSTIAANSHLLCSDTSHVQVLEYEWGGDWPESATVNDPSVNSRPTFDIIFGSDVAYRPDLYEPLIASLRMLSDVHTRIYLGVTMADTCPDFFRRLTRDGFAYRRLDDRLLEPEHRGLTFGIFVVRRHVPWYSYRPDDEEMASAAAAEPILSDNPPANFG